MLGSIGTIQGIDEHIGFLVRRDVATNILTKHLRVAVDIEEVVLQLEGESDQFTCLIEIRQIVG